MELETKQRRTISKSSSSSFSKPCVDETEEETSQSSFETVSSTSSCTSSIERVDELLRCDFIIIGKRQNLSLLVSTDACRSCSLASPPKLCFDRNLVSDSALDDGIGDITVSCDGNRRSSEMPYCFFTPDFIHGKGLHQPERIPDEQPSPNTHWCSNLGTWRSSDSISGPCLRLLQKRQFSKRKQRDTFRSCMSSIHRSSPSFVAYTVANLATVSVA